MFSSETCAEIAIPAGFPNELHGMEISVKPFPDQPSKELQPPFPGYWVSVKDWLQLANTKFLRNKVA